VAVVIFKFNPFIKLEYLATDFMWNGFFINARLAVNNLVWLSGYTSVVHEFMAAYEPVANHFV
jgi:hypothetical protein